MLQTLVPEASVYSRPSDRSHRWQSIIVTCSCCLCLQINVLLATISWAHQ